MTATKVYTVRIPQDEAQQIEFVARVEGLSVNDVFRTALARYFEEIKGDDGFVGRAKAQLANDRKVAKRLV